jgi:hypothetical protein
VQVKTSPSLSLSLSVRTFAGGVSFFVYICWLLVLGAAKIFCLTCPLLCWPLRLCALSSSPLLSLWLLLTAFAGGVFSLPAVGCCCLVLPYLSAALLAAAPSRPLSPSLPLSLSLSLTTFAGGVFFVAGCWTLLLGAA